MSADVVSPEFHLLQRGVAGRYSLVRELGRGGMGVVFLAREVSLDRLVAIKLLPPVFAARPELRERFIREARTAAQLSHPHIVAIHAVESATDLVFFVMEFVPGETLGARIRRDGAITGSEGVRITQEVAWAIAHAHARGVVHRDIKPDNILLEEGTDRAIVTDFGIARAATQDAVASNPAIGTFHYMSPEQAAGDSVDARTDVYALGVTAFHAVSGRRPFEGYDGAVLIAHQAMAEAPPVSSFAPTLPPRFADAIDRAIRRDPTARWPSMEVMAQELAAARAVAPALPVLTRHFARDAREQLSRAATGIAVAASTEIVLIVGFSWDDFGASIVMHLIALIMGATALSALGTLLVRTRDLLKRGYGRGAALRAVQHEVSEQPAVLPALPHPLFDNRAFLVVAGTVVTAACVMATRASDSFIPGVFAVMGAILTPVGVALQWTRGWSGRTTAWARMMQGRFGQLLFEVASVGLGSIREAPSAGEPTALALGGAVGGIYARLPDAQRRALSEVPALITRLEAIAMDRARPDHVQAMMALETLRLDLLRLQAGEIAAESLTQEFERLRDVGFVVDGLVEARGAG